VVPAVAAVVLSFLVQATPTSQTLGPLRVRDAATFQDAIDVFGAPDACTKRSWFSMAVWRTLGFRLRVTTLGGLTPAKTFCTDPRHVHIDSAVMTGTRWHTVRGLRIGDTAAKLHRLYPHARRFRQGWASCRSTRAAGSASANRRSTGCRA
jgi:hypothetical protein